MSNKAINQLYLHFADKAKEREFVKEYDTDNRIFFRNGIYLSCFAWFIWYSGIYFSHHEVFRKALVVLIAVLLIPFIIVVTLSFFKKYSTLNHYITAWCNFAAACVCIYAAVYLSKDITLLCSGVVCINFFCYFILRIRYIVSLFVTASYGWIAQYCVIASHNFTNDQVYVASSGIWLGFFIATIAGYFFERTNRKIFVQNKVIEKQRGELVDERNKLKQSLTDLKSTQAQLIHSEKMASLGELTAGIAHEIQNPLNFVNNFSEVSNELIDEMTEQLAVIASGAKQGNMQQAIELADNVKQNLDKINHHGKRADAIVKGMLQHTRTSSGQQEPTDINSLADEYLRLAYHGLRAKDKSFNVTTKTEFDESLSADEAGIGKINVIRQDFGRVILNLINNAFYAVNEKSKQNVPGYDPTVTILTQKLDGTIQISVADNGNGIPQKNMDKIFQPFFTTKPAGMGTGLGLSLAYDIIKAHGGEIRVETKEGNGSKFIIHLPDSH